ncbi:MAG: hypothetical protein GX493_04645 [Firmicutes bacterium]|nr:hypothetical protein [Bacillota bacterium]
MKKRGHESLSTKRQRIRRFLVIVSFLLFPATFYYLSPYLGRVIKGSLILLTMVFISVLFL